MIVGADLAGGAAPGVVARGGVGVEGVGVEGVGVKGGGVEGVTDGTVLVTVNVAVSRLGWRPADARTVADPSGALDGTVITFENFP